MNYQIGQVRYLGQALIDGKLEGDRSENQCEAECQAVLNQFWWHSERHKHEARDQKLKLETLLIILLYVFVDNHIDTLGNY